MTLSQVQPNIAILVASGFEENHITAVQRQLTQAQLSYHIVAPEQGLVNGWQGAGWGHYFTVDVQLGTAMGSDYEVLIIAGGERGVAKLRENPHTRRIVNHFLEAGKPIAAIGSGVGLLALSPKSAGLSAAAAGDVHAEIKDAKMELSADAMASDGVVLTADGSDVEGWVEGLMALISATSEAVAGEQAAA